MTWPSSLHEDVWRSLRRNPGHPDGCFYSCRNGVVGVRAGRFRRISDKSKPARSSQGRKNSLDLGEGRIKAFVWASRLGYPSSCLSMQEVIGSMVGPQLAAQAGGTRGAPAAGSRQGRAKEKLSTFKDTMVELVRSISNGDATWASCSRQKVPQSGLDKGTGHVAMSPSTCSRDLCSQPGISLAPCYQ
jgi:hypothetical protein